MTPPATQRTDLLEQSLLLERCKEGDPAAWNRLIGSCRAFIYRIARYLSGNDADACDITSQVFLRLYQHIDHCRCGSSFRSWLYRIIYNAYVDICIRDGYRKHIRLDEPLSPDGPQSGLDVLDPSRSPEEQCLQNEAIFRLVHVIRHLPNYQRQVLTMYARGYTYEEIAGQLGVSIGTVKSRLSRAREMVTARLADAG